MERPNKEAMSIGEVLSKVQNLQLSQKEVLAAYDHITLTDEEIIEALIWAKRKKIDTIQRMETIQREAENRTLSQMQWNFDIMKSFMIKRSKDIVEFKNSFVLDENNQEFFDLLCYYFLNDEKFIYQARQMCPDEQGAEPINWSLEKGLLICGNFGCGKTWMMKLFARNNRQTFYVRTAKKIAIDYLNAGRNKNEDVDIPEQYLNLFENPSNDSNVFYQKFSGLCIDDLGAEDKKNNYGNVMNVIGDLIERRYEKRYTGVYLHATTNLDATQIKEFYGERVVSRMREIFNFIELPGPDRRK